LVQGNSASSLKGLEIANNSLNTVAANPQVTCLLCLTNTTTKANAVGAALLISGTATAGDIGYGIDIGTTGITTDIILQNNATIDNDTAGQIKLATAGTTGNLAIVDFIGGPTLTGATTGLTVDVSGSVPGTQSLTGLNIASFTGGSAGSNIGMNIAGVAGTGTSQ
jgi:hypothetical protein